jgi:hypothetical protein
MMGILKILDGTTIEQLNDLNARRKAAGIAYLQGEGNRRRGVRISFAEGGRREQDSAPTGRRSADSASSGRRSSNSTKTISPSQDPL